MLLSILELDVELVTIQIASSAEFSPLKTCHQFPTFGLQAWRNSCILFYFDFSMTYVGAGMICSHLVNLSLILGAIVSWGIMWPLIKGLKGEWFPASIPESRMKSLNDLIRLYLLLQLGDGFYNFLKVLYFTGTNIHANMKKKNLNNTFSDNQKQLPLDDLRRNEMFARENIPIWLACTGYIFFSVISILFCLPLAGKSDGVVAGLVGCGLIKSIVSISSDLMHDLKTGHLTLTSPRSMLVSQAIDWRLFDIKLGHNGTPITLSPEIEKIAKCIVERCDGLPLGFSVMARTMKGIDDFHQWKHALNKLEKLEMGPEVEEEVLKVLKRSYDNLMDKNLQNCFLYCALFCTEDKDDDEYNNDGDKDELIMKLVISYYMYICACSCIKIDM
ncbi:hypothetical protein P8452_62182 [Trifolium repens]|nr:hypothetical protein P8452_62182 [Trifolium repens]